MTLEKDAGGSEVLSAAAVVVARGVPVAVPIVAPLLTSTIMITLVAYRLVSLGPGKPDCRKHSQLHFGFR